MHVIKASINGNPNIGLYGYTTDKFCLLGKEVPKAMVKKIEEVLQVPVFQLNIAGTSLLGVFLAGNDNCLLIPHIVLDHEIRKLDEISKKAGFTYKIIHTDLTALGNNILCNNKGCLYNPEFEKEARKEIEEALKVEAKEGRIADLPTVGSVAVMNGKGCAIHRDAENFEIDFVGSLLGIGCESATVNMGNPFLSSGILVNDKGFIVGDISGGPEVTYLDEIFGFLE